MSNINLATVEKIVLLGDTHGAVGAHRRATQAAHDAGTKVIVQLGDWGLWNHTQWGMNFIDTVSAWLEQEDCWLFWIKGNHENHDLLLNSVQNGVRYPDCPVEVAPRIWHLPNGTYFSIGEMSFLVCGGAVSVDKAWRTEGVDWWRDEEITYGDLLHCTRPEIDVVDVLLSHDAPSHVPLDTLLDSHHFSLGHKLDNESAGQRKLLAELCDAVQPQFVFHGHYHNYHDTLVNADGYDMRVIGLDRETSTENMGLLDTVIGTYAKL